MSVRVRRGLVALAVALALLAWWSWPEARQVAAAEPAPEPLAASVPRTRPGLPDAAPPPEIAPVPEPDAPEQSPEYAAVAAFAEASGRTLIQCPSSVFSSHIMMQPGRCTSAPGGTTCAVDQPDGVVLLRPIHGTDLEAGSFQLPSGPPQSILHWWTEADGSTRCVEEDPSPTPVRVRVVDPSGHPLPAVVGSLHDLELIEADPDGWASVPTWNGASIEIQVITPSSRTEALVDPGDGEVTVVVNPEAEVPADDHSPEITDIDATLAAGGLPDDVVAVLEKWRAALAPTQ